MIKLTVWTRPDYANNIYAKSRCIFNGKVYQVPSIDMGIVIADGFCVERIEHIYYSIYNNTAEIRIASMDLDMAYPTVSFKD